MKKFKFNNQKGVSLVEGMTAAAILGLAVTVFMTLQSYQERDFANLRKFDKAAYAVEFMFEAPMLDDDRNLDLSDFKFSVSESSKGSSFSITEYRRKGY